MNEADWTVHHEDTPTAGGDDGTWRFGYKWAVTSSAVTADGWGPCYPACGESVQFREVVCIRSDETVVDDSLCSESSHPVLHRSCYNYSECHPCWAVGEWSHCGAV